MKKFELPPEYERENLKEKQKEALTAMGFESIAELNDFIEGAKEEFKNTSDDRLEYVEIKEQKEYF